MWSPLILLACGQAPEPVSYIEACEASLGPWPEVTCDDGVVVPIPVTGRDGVTRLGQGPSDLEDGVACDRPSPISGCVVGSRAGSVRTERAVYHFVCRRNHPDTPPGMYDDIALIGHDPSTGAACFFGAAADGTLRDGSLPRPTGPDDRGYWASLPELAALRCRDCHDGDPIVVTPWIEGAGVIDNDPFAPFELLGEAELEALEPGWGPGRRLVHPEAAACTACHDLTERFSCDLAAQATGSPVAGATEAASVYPASHWMDAFDPQEILARYPTESDWEAAFGVARQTVEGCCTGRLPADLCYSQE